MIWASGQHPILIHLLPDDPRDFAHVMVDQIVGTMPAGNLNALRTFVRKTSGRLKEICLRHGGRLYFCARFETADIRGWRAPHNRVTSGSLPGVSVLEQF